MYRKNVTVMYVTYNENGAEFLGGVRFSFCSNLYQEQYQTVFLRCVVCHQKPQGKKYARTAVADCKNHLSPPSLSSEPPLCLSDLTGRTLRRSLPPGFADAFPYHIIPRTARIIPRTTWRFRPSLPKKRKPRNRTSTVFMWPKTWKDTAENRPMQMNWLRLTPMAMMHESTTNNCSHKMQW